MTLMTVTSLEVYVLNKKISSQYALKALLIASLILGSLSVAALPVADSPQITPAAPLPPTGYPIFFPFIAKDPLDLSVSNIEVTQAVQNLSNPVKLVANRVTAVRVYARANGVSQVGNVTASLVGYRNGTRLGMLTAAAGSAYPWSDSLDSLRASASKSFNFTLPSSWTAAGNLTLAANIDINNSISEVSEVNTTTLQYSFNTVPTLNVIAVPIRYYDTNFRMLFPEPNINYLQEALYRMYPVPAVNITAHKYLFFMGDLSNSGYWELLLDQITSLKDSEGQPDSTVYFGVIPLLDAKGDSWFTGGNVGLGYVGYRASIATTLATINVEGENYLLDGDDYAAHEIGHNLNMMHTPCGNPADPDPNYPYSNAAIGQYGYYVSTGTVMAKTRPDIMSYCEPEWVSDYTYNAWYSNQRATALAVTEPVQDSLYVRAKLGSDGSAVLQPVYGFSASPNNIAASSDYTIQFLDAAEKVVSEYPVRVLKAEERGISVQTIHARLPKPSQPYHSVRVLHLGQALDNRTINPDALQATAAPSLRVDGKELLLSWATSGRPALVRFTSDGGQTWNTIGIDDSSGELRLPLSELPNLPLQFQVIPADGGPAATVDWAP